MAVTCSTKWPCPACTYNNWPSCSKCVLCGINKPSDDDVIPRIPVAKYRQQNPGWSKLSSSSNPPTSCIPTTQPKLTQQERNNLSTSDSSPTMSSHAHGYTGQQLGKSTSKSKTKGKWICSTCTYVNWPNAGQCVMCRVNRFKSSRNEPSTTRNEAIDKQSSARTSPSCCDSILGYASGVEAEGGDSALHSGELSVQSNPKPKSGRNSNRVGSGGSCNEGKKKWRCSYCTYDNWHSAIKCTMCQNVKGRTPTPPLASGVRVESSSGITPSPPPPLHVPRGRRSSPPSSSHNQQQTPSPRLVHLPVSLTSSSPTSSLTSSNIAPSNTNIYNSSNSSLHGGGLLPHSNSNNESVEQCKVVRNESSTAFRPVATPALLESGCGGSRERRSPHSGPGLRQLQLNNVTDEVSDCGWSVGSCLVEAMPGIADRKLRGT